MKCIGKCVWCGSEDIEYGESVIGGDQLGYKISCNECNRKSVEWYKLVYVGSTKLQEG